MGIELHRSDRPEMLARAFADLLRADPADVFTPEVVVVPARGVERWLAQRLSHVLGSASGDDGVCAGLRILAPQSLVGLLLDRDRDDPWQADRLVWPTLEAIDTLTGSPTFEALTHHLGAGPPIAGDPRAEWERRARQSRRYAVARRIAGLFASYARERPQLLEEWEAGHATDGHGHDLPPDFAWQPILWRHTVDLVRRGGADESVVERHRRVVGALRSGSLPLDLPSRISLFGHTRLSTSERDLLFALGAGRQVHLWLPHPSPALWSALEGRTAVGLRADDRSAHAARHPLLATLGRDIREVQAAVSTGQVTDHGPARTGEHRPDRLGLLQGDVRANRAPDPTRQVQADDYSIQVHACHGRARQVEVLREVLTWLLAEGRGALQPRDILVMCPDIQQFAPLIQATFGLSLAPAPDEAHDAHHPGQRLRVRLADRSLGETNPLVDLAQRVVALVAGRMTVSEVLDLAGHEAVRARFGFDEESLDRVARWVRDGGVRWGYDARHRGEYGLGAVEANTWTRGLDRIALGVAVAADTEGACAARVPVDDVGSRDIEILGRFAELVERLKVAADAARGRGREDDLAPGTMPTSAWMQWLRETVGALAATGPDEQWQFTQLARDLTTVDDAAGDRTLLRLNDIRVMLDQRWGARPTRANFRTGAVTVCTMVPMRSVPHRAVVVLGVDDGVYPRSPVTDGDDVLARRPRVGERDARSEDRQLLLDAVMAAEEHFVAIYSGFDERNGSRRPPAVPLQELVSVAARTATVAGDRPAVAGEEAATPTFVRQHPLQAFDERNFRADGPVPGGTFDTASLAGAQALRAQRATPAPPSVFLEQPLPALPVTAVSVEDLVAFLQNPAREFLRHRLEVTVPRDADEVDDAIPIEIDALDRWQIGERVLAEVLGGLPLEDALEREVVRGALPPGALGHRARSQIARAVAAIAEGEDRQTPRSVDVRIDLASDAFEGGRIRLSGLVGGIRADTLGLWTYSTISAKHVAAAWVRLLALAVSEPERDHLAQLTGKKGGRQLRSPSAESARTLLIGLLHARQSGLRFPMGMPPKTACAFAGVHHPDRQGEWPPVDRSLDRVRSVWEGGDFPGENDDPWWRLALGPHSRVEELNRRRGIEYFAPRIWHPIRQHGGDV